MGYTVARVFVVIALRVVQSDSLVDIVYLDDEATDEVITEDTAKIPPEVACYIIKREGNYRLIQEPHARKRKRNPFRK